MKIQLFDFLIFYLLPWKLLTFAMRYFYLIHMPLFDLINSLNLFKISLGQFSGGHLELRLNTLYDGVETFVLFMSHAWSGLSLIGAILDAHLEIINKNEKLLS